MSGYLENLEGNYHLYLQQLPLICTLSQISPIRTLSNHFCKISIYFNLHYTPSLQTSLYPSGFPIKALYISLAPPMRATLFYALCTKSHIIARFSFLDTKTHVICLRFVKLMGYLYELNWQFETSYQL